MKCCMWLTHQNSTCLVNKGKQYHLFPPLHMPLKCSGCFQALTKTILYSTKAHLKLNEKKKVNERHTFLLAHS